MAQFNQLEIQKYIDEAVDRKIDDMGLTDFKGMHEDTLKFLKSLRPVEIEELKEAAEVAKTTKMLSTFVKWTVYTLIATVVAFSQFWESIQKIKSFFPALIGK